jgi:hypothetical protein
MILDPQYLKERGRNRLEVFLLAERTFVPLRS